MKLFSMIQKNFQVKGIRVSSEERKTKPAGINQYFKVNFDGGLLGLIRGIKDGLLSC